MDFSTPAVSPLRKRMLEDTGAIPPNTYSHSQIAIAP